MDRSTLSPTDPGAVVAEDHVDAPENSAEQVEQLRREVARLRARIAELESSAKPDGSGAPVEPFLGDVAARNSYHYLLSLVNHAPNPMFIKDLEHRFAVISKRGAQALGKSPEEIVGCTEREWFPPPVAEKLIAEEVRVLKSGEPLEYEQELGGPNGSRHYYTIKFPIYDTTGAPLGVGAFITDITELKRAEADRIALKEEVIRAQQAALREMSTPLLPLASGVIAMPIVGTIDSVRASEILETLLEGINRHAAHTAILDITGVRLVDTQVANALIGAARAARLLGARMVLTGISPAVAQTLVQLEARLDGIVTLGTLASGIAFALRTALATPGAPAAPAPAAEKSATP